MDLIGRLGVTIQTNRVVPAEEDENSHERVPWKFDDDVRKHERLPGVSLAGTLTDLVQSTLGDEVGHDLLDELTKDSHQHEDTKHLVLETLLSVGHVVKRETDEKSRGNTEEGLGVDVGRAAPILLEDTLGSLTELLAERSGKLAVGGFIFSLLSGDGTLETVCLRALDLELLKMALDFSILRRVAPYLVPVNVSVRSGSSTNDFKHPLSRVSLRGTLRTSVTDKVIDKDFGVLTDITVVNGATTSSEEKETIETLEQHGRRLVDSAENGLAVLLQLVQKIKNSPRGLRVETGSRLVQEEKQGRLGSQLDTNSKTLALFNVETFARYTDDSIGVLIHIKELNDFADVFNFLLTRNVGGLTEEGGEGESFTDGRSGQVQILLLSVTGLALERLVTGDAVNQHLTTDDTHGSTSSQDVKQSSLTSTRHTHEGSQSTRLDPTVNVVQNAAGFTLDLNVVANVFPLEDGSLALDDGDVVVAVGVTGGPTSWVALEVVGGFSLGNLETTAEDKDFALRLSRGNELGSDKVDHHKTDQEYPEDTEVAPLVRALILIR